MQQHISRMILFIKYVGNGDQEDVLKSRVLSLIVRKINKHITVLTMSKIFLKFQTIMWLKICKLWDYY